MVLLVIAFIIRFICGHCFGRKFSKSESPIVKRHHVQLYEDVHVLPSAMHPQEEHDLELNGNVAHKSLNAIFIFEFRACAVIEGPQLRRQRNGETKLYPKRADTVRNKLF